MSSFCSAFVLHFVNENLFLKPDYLQFAKESQSEYCVRLFETMKVERACLTFIVLCLLRIIGYQRNQIGVLSIWVREKKKTIGQP
jgi:hypothetical protein